MFFMVCGGYFILGRDLPNITMIVCLGRYRSYNEDKRTLCFFLLQQHIHSYTQDVYALECVSYTYYIQWKCNLNSHMIHLLSPSHIEHNLLVVFLLLVPLKIDYPLTVLSEKCLNLFLLFLFFIVLFLFF